MSKEGKLMRPKQGNVMGPDASLENDKKERKKHNQLQHVEEVEQGGGAGSGVPGGSVTLSSEEEVEMLREQIRKIQLLHDVEMREAHNLVVQVPSPVYIILYLCVCLSS
jgi:hypothetical protein